MARYAYSSSNGCVYGYNPGENKLTPDNMVEMSIEEVRVYEDYLKAAKKNRRLKCPTFPLQGTQTYIPKPRKARKIKEKVVEAEVIIADDDVTLEDILDGTDNS